MPCDMPSTPTVSLESTFVSEARRDARKSASRSFALYGKKAREAIDSIFEIAKSCSVSNWDDADAKPIGLGAATRAAQFIFALPQNLLPDEIDPDSEGCISLRWVGGYRRVCSILIDGGDRVACAGLDGASSWHSAEHFDGSTISDALTGSIRRAME